MLVEILSDLTVEIEVLFSRSNVFTARKLSSPWKPDSCGSNSSSKPTLHNEKWISDQRIVEVITEY